MDWAWGNSGWSSEILPACKCHFARRRRPGLPPTPPQPGSDIGIEFSWRQGHRNVIRSDLLYILQQRIDALFIHQIQVVTGRSVRAGHLGQESQKEWWKMLEVHLRVNVQRSLNRHANRLELL